VRGGHANRRAEGVEDEHADRAQVEHVECERCRRNVRAREPDVVHRAAERERGRGEVGEVEREEVVGRRRARGERGLQRGVRPRRGDDERLREPPRVVFGVQPGPERAGGGPCERQCERDGGRKQPAPEPGLAHDRVADLGRLRDRRARKHSLRLGQRHIRLERCDNRVHMFLHRGGHREAEDEIERDERGGHERRPRAAHARVRRVKGRRRGRAQAASVRHPRSVGVGGGCRQAVVCARDTGAATVGRVEGKPRSARAG
jgi:hypothetical protein